MADEPIPPNDEGDAKPWQPELSALKEELTDSQTQYQSLKQQTESLSESLTQSRQELSDLGQKVQSILKESSPPPPAKKTESESESDKKPTPISDDGKSSKKDPGASPEPPEPPTPPAPEKPPHRRRSI